MQRDKGGNWWQNGGNLQPATSGQNACMAGIKKGNGCKGGKSDALKKSLRQPVSAFRHYAAPAASTTLGTWLSACTTPMGTTAQKAASTCERIRAEVNEGEQKRLKKSLPGFTPGCLIHDGGGRNEDEITQASPFVQLDIDPDQNPGIPMGEPLKEALFQLPYIVFCGLSTRGTGVWALVEVENLAFREQHFHQLVQDIERAGITIDKSKGVRPHDFRFYSYDPHGLWRQHWQVYTRMQPVSTITQHWQPIKVQRRKTSSGTRQELTSERKIALIANEAERKGIDLSEADYHQWVKIGFAIYHELGESGRDYFHQISSPYPGYTYEVTDKKFNDITQARAGTSSATIRSLVEIAKQHDIYLKELIKHETT